jgi:hypothetical protein
MFASLKHTHKSSELGLALHKFAFFTRKEMTSLKSTLKSSAFNSLKSEQLRDAWIRRVNKLKRDQDLEESENPIQKNKKRKGKSDSQEKSKEFDQNLQKFCKKEGKLAEKLAESLRMLVVRLVEDHKAKDNEKKSLNPISNYEQFVEILSGSLSHWAKRNAELMTRNSKNTEDVRLQEIASKRLANLVIQQHAQNLWKSYRESINV